MATYPVSKMKIGSCRNCVYTSQVNDTEERVHRKLNYLETNWLVRYMYTVSGIYSCRVLLSSRVRLINCERMSAELESALTVTFATFDAVSTAAVALVPVAIAAAPTIRPTDLGKAPIPLPTTTATLVPFQTVLAVVIKSP